MQKLKDQKGFAIVEAVLVVLLLMAVGTAGYFAYQDHHSKNSKTQSAARTTSMGANKKATATPPNPYAGWKAGSLAAENLSFKYPSGWTLTSEQESGGSSLVNLKDTTGFGVNIDSLKPGSTVAQLGGSNANEPFNTTVGSFILADQTVYLLDDLDSTTNEYESTELSSCNGTKKCLVQNKATGDDIELSISYNHPGKTDFSGGSDEFAPTAPEYLVAIKIAETLSF